MTDAEWRSLENYVAHTAALLGLHGWGITLSREPAEGGYEAQVYQPYDRRRTWIKVKPDWLSNSAEEQRDTIVHEPLHLHLAEMGGALNSELGEIIGAPAYKVLYEQYRLAEERAVDTMARALAPLLPLWTRPSTASEGKADGAL